MWFKWGSLQPREYICLHHSMACIICPVCLMYRILFSTKSTVLLIVCISKTARQEWNGTSLSVQICRRTKRCGRSAQKLSVVQVAHGEWSALRFKKLLELPAASIGSSNMQIDRAAMCSFRSFQSFVFVLKIIWLVAAWRSDNACYSAWSPCRARQLWGWCPTWGPLQLENTPKIIHSNRLLH